MAFNMIPLQTFIAELRARRVWHWAERPPAGLAQWEHVVAPAYPSGAATRCFSLVIGDEQHLLSTSSAELLALQAQHSAKTTLALCTKQTKSIRVISTSPYHLVAGCSGPSSAPCASAG